MEGWLAGWLVGWWVGGNVIRLTLLFPQRWMNVRAARASTGRVLTASTCLRVCALTGSTQERPVKRVIQSAFKHYSC